MSADLQKHTLNLRTGDYQTLVEIFAPQGVSAATVIRRLVSRYVDSLVESNEVPQLKDQKL